MKKIKYLLLGIVSLFGIGSSFGYDYNFYSVEFFNNYNYYSNYSLVGGNDSFKFMSANGGTFSSLNNFLWSGLQVFDYNSVSDSRLNPSNYSLINELYYGGDFTYLNSRIFNNGNGITILFPSERYYGTYSFVVSSGNVLSSNQLNQKGAFVRAEYNGLDYSIISDNPFITSSPSTAYRTWIFTPNSVIDSDRGEVFDTSSQSIHYNRGVISPGVLQEYSFGISYVDALSGQNYIDISSVPYFFRTIIPTYGSGLYSVYRNVFVIKLDTLYKKTNTGDFKILVLSFTGSSLNDSNLDLIYSRYSCPYDAFTMTQCEFIDGGFVRSSNLSNSFTSYNGSLINLTGTTNFSDFLFYFLTSPYPSLNSGVGNFTPNLYSVESNNIIQLYRPFYGVNGGGYSENNRSFVLVSSDGIDILGTLYSPDFNGTGFLQFSSCITTEVCTVSGYQTTCTTQCITHQAYSSGSYFGSDGTLYYVDSPYNVGNISDSDGVVYDTGFLDEDGMLSIDYYSGLFNGQGFKLGVCPYPPSNYLNFATKIKLGNFYPFMPLNCFISAFQQGVKVHYFDDSGLFPDNHSQLMAGDSHYHKTLFRFFDVLLSIGLLLLLSALLRIIKK